MKSRPKMLIEEARRRLSARAARHMPHLTVVEVQIGNSAAKKPFVLCPFCSARVWYLYQARDGSPFACARCAGLVYRSAREAHRPLLFHRAVRDDKTEWAQKWKQAIRERRPEDLEQIYREWKAADRTAKRPRKAATETATTETATTEN